MDRKEALSHKKKKGSLAMLIGTWTFIFGAMAILIAFIYSLFGGNIFGNKNYWLTVGVVNGLLLIGYLFLYRIDAQNIAMKENDLEDTEWLTSKKLRKMNEFTVTTWDGVKEHDDEIVIGAEKTKKGGVEVISTSQLHALIVGTTGSGKVRPDRV